MAISLVISLFIIVLGFEKVRANNLESNYTLPPLQIHPLPLSLANWQFDEAVGDYFSAIESTPLGYLIWSEFPIKVYLEQPTEASVLSASGQRQHRWLEAVSQALEEWNLYLPLLVVDNSDLADIIILRSSPPLDVTINPETGLFDLPRASSAQTSYDFYLTSDDPPKLSHKMTIEIKPGQSFDSILGAARHEIGHGLGIWGHSPEENDTMFFSQTRDIASISPRDINTLKKIYLQPTQLGWKLSHKQIKINTNYK